MSALHESNRGTTRRLRGRVTIQDVARETGLAKGTVSRALNDYADIAEGTRKRVKQAARRLGYIPLSHAQAIRTGRVRSIGLVLQESEHDGHRPFLTDFLAGLSEAASAESWTMTVATARTETDTMRTLGRLVDERKADGFVLPRTYLDDKRVTFLRGANVPFVMFGRIRDDEDCCWFDIDSETATRESVARLLALGHRRIGFVGAGAGYTFSKLRLDGYLAGLADAGLPEEPDLMVSDVMTRADGVVATQRLLALPRPPTAIVFAVDRAAFGAYDAAAMHGLRIGQDLSVLSYDGLPEGDMMTPPLSTHSVDMRHAGERLAHLLIGRIRGDDPADLKELAQARWVARGSHGAPAMTTDDLAKQVASSQ